MPAKAFCGSVPQMTEPSETHSYSERLQRDGQNRRAKVSEGESSKETREGTGFSAFFFPHQHAILRGETTLSKARLMPFLYAHKAGLSSRFLLGSSNPNWFNPRPHAVEIGLYVEVQKPVLVTIPISGGIRRKRMYMIEAKSKMDVRSQILQIDFFRHPHNHPVVIYSALVDADGWGMKLYPII